MLREIRQDKQDSKDRQDGKHMQRSCKSSPSCNPVKKIEGWLIGLNVDPGPGDWMILLAAAATIVLCGVQLIRMQ